MLRRVTSAHSSRLSAGAAAAPRPPGVLYTPEPGAFDEAIEPDGTPRPAYAGLLEALAETDLNALAEDVHADICRHGIEFGGKGGPEPFRLDLVPRVITAEEWDVVERGLAQRVRALDRFVADAYGEQEIVEAGVLPGRVLESCDHFEPRLVGLPAPPVRVAIAGLDLVRDPDGRFYVLEDNVRTPSGTTYALAARETLDRHLPAGLAEGASRSTTCSTRWRRRCARPPRMASTTRPSCCSATAPRTAPGTSTSGSQRRCRSHS